MASESSEPIPTLCMLPDHPFISSILIQSIPSDAGRNKWTRNAGHEITAKQLYSWARIKKSSEVLISHTFATLNESINEQKTSTKQLTQ